jgi:hypothetical protein
MNEKRLECVVYEYGRDLGLRERRREGEREKETEGGRERKRERDKGR